MKYSMHSNIAFMGECMVELSMHDAQLIQGYGGDTYNTAVYLSRLNKYFDTSLKLHYLTGLGKDPLSKSMLSNFQKEGLNIDQVIIDDKRLPGIYYIDKDEQGERSFYFWRSNSAAKFIFENTDATFSHIQNSDVIFLSLISLAILPPADRSRFVSWLKTIENRPLIIFDNNYRAALWENSDLAASITEQMMNISDILLLSLEDDQAMFSSQSSQSVIQRVRKTNNGTVIVKDGGNECWYSDSTTELGCESLAKIDKVVDSTAAGDSFNAGFLYRLFQGANTADAIRSGHLLASFVIQQPGAISNSSQLQSFLESNT